MQTHSPSETSPALDGHFREHGKLVFQSAYRITGNAVDAEDVLQTVFLRLAARSESPDVSPNPRAYFHRAAVNAAIDLIRSRSATKTLSIEDVAPSAFASPNDDPEMEQERREMQEILRRAVAALGRTAAEIFALRHFEGCDNEEIAAALGMNKMVVAVLLHRAKARVRKEIQKALEISR
jgi:RNA polymerase sigma-70 factor (ECF subfamily)